ncbi:PHO85 cyclin-5 [Coemansia sp. RSA 989]|nr:PHO85 cyclin-5 [Coemansia sp. RSA 1086]KAJ1753221.1 PHO85 cyclin-5 [Coemansia sp. RSA 1821]KAJ1868163.1 PHO85 cyclin-5 [Coemansia sp. RSA 989]KAJ1872342.1 PHO85 cyclin-5 [Coemansia sp. RSA 990]KAJ2633005.1 PHO85 cyclin-5 [Coemansia sp. RSA 1290]KAJ2653474.1 PHO85 cyclin-5 [Coemansia sp. RSA 1250]KAJ2676400.1 PHO85 cyclin-5 [Coemansia sp. RSA 1085]
MVSLQGKYPIESNTRLHHQDAVPAGSGLPLSAHTRGLALHVGGWDNEQAQMHNSAFEFSKNIYGKVNQQTEQPTGTKRTSDLDLPQSKRAREQPAEDSARVRIDDLLNPDSAAGAQVSAAGSSLAAAHRMSVPTALSRTRSADAKLSYQQLAQLQLQLQQQMVKPTDSAMRLARTATAPGMRSAVAQGLVRDALELDKLYDIACVIIESIWPNHSTSQSIQLCSLRCFVAETHRQSCLGADVLELAMFYLLRAKSFLQAKQHAERQKEEQEMLQQKYCAPSKAELDNTPPLSPADVVPGSIDSQQQRPGSNSGSNGLVSAPMVVPVASNGGAAVPSSGTFTSPMDSISPITPDSVQHGQVSYVGMTAQQLTANGMITPLTPKKSKLALAAAAQSLPSAPRPQASQPAVQIPKPQQTAEGAKAPAQKPNPARCGRRMFVAALICATKFMYDQSFTTRAWHKATKLPPKQICDMERAFLDMIDYRLYVDRTTYERFHRRLARSGMRNGRIAVGDSAGLGAKACQQPNTLSSSTTAVSSPASKPSGAQMDIRSAISSISSCPTRTFTAGNGSI